MIAEWKPSYSCGVESLDEQHTALVGLNATLQQAMADARVKEEVAEMIENLLFYTRYHFAWEEQWLDQHGFKGLAAHMAEHERLTHEVLQLQARLREGKVISGMPLMRLLQEWLVSHIDQRDKAAVASALGAQHLAAYPAYPRALENVAD